MRRWLPHPLLSLSLLAMWLLLNQSLALGQFILGSAVALLAAQAMAALRPEPVRIRSYRPIPRLMARVAADIVRSNFAVARIVVRPRKDRVAGFMHVPLDIRSRYGLTALACILTATPGTMWIELDRASGRVLIHVLDLVDEAHWIDLIKHRYERLLMEIFE
jgi:multicomponent K+:H+ antiporter subunit E